VRGPWFRDSESPIGEAWHLAGQVHPDDGEDGPPGKIYLTPAHTVHAGTNARFLGTYVPR
jgi:hypothetical protein